MDYFKEGVMGRRRWRASHSPAATHWSTFVGDAMASSLKLRATLVLHSNEDASFENTKFIVRLCLSTSGTVQNQPEGLLKTWDVVRSASSFLGLEQALLSAGLHVSKLNHTVISQMHSHSLGKHLAQWFASVLLLWQREERRGLNLFRRRLSPDQIAMLADRVEWFVFDQGSFRSLFTSKSMMNFASALERVRRLRNMQRRDTELLMAERKLRSSTGGLDTPVHSPQEGDQGKFLLTHLTRSSNRTHSRHKVVELPQEEFEIEKDPKKMLPSTPEPTVRRCSSDGITAQPPAPLVFGGESSLLTVGPSQKIGHSRNCSEASTFSAGSDFYHLRFSKNKTVSMNSLAHYLEYDDSLLGDDDEESFYDSFVEDAAYNSSRCTSMDSTYYEKVQGMEQKQRVLQGSPQRAFKRSYKGPSASCNGVGRVIKYEQIGKETDTDFALFNVTVTYDALRLETTPTDAESGRCSPVSVPDTPDAKRGFFLEAHTYTDFVLDAAKEQVGLMYQE